MPSWWTAAAAFLVLLTVAGPAAAVDTPGPPAAAVGGSAGGGGMAAGAACMPPCGYIVPMMDLVVPDKPSCAAGLGQEVDLSACIAMPAEGGSVTFPATLVWEWETSEDGTYPNDPEQDIEVSFQGTAGNPSWLSFDVQPATFVLTTADLLDPTNLEQREKEGSTAGAVWFRKSWPVNITFSRTSTPVGDEAAEVQEAGGAVNVYVKARSSASGERFKPSWYVEKFTFSGAGLVAGAGEDTPGVPPVVVLGGVLAVAVMWRRTGRPGPPWQRP